MSMLHIEMKEFTRISLHLKLFGLVMLLKGFPSILFFPVQHHVLLVL